MSPNAKQRSIELSAYDRMFDLDILQASCIQHIRPHLTEYTGSRPLSARQTVKRPISTALGDHAGILAVVCLLLLFALFLQRKVDQHISFWRKHMSGHFWRSSLSQVCPALLRQPEVKVSYQALQRLLLTPAYDESAMFDEDRTHANSRS